MSPSATFVCINGCLLLMFKNSVGRKWACSFINCSLNQVQRGWDEERLYSVKRAPDSSRSRAPGTAALQPWSFLTCSSRGTVSRPRKAAFGCMVDGRVRHMGLQRTSDFGDWSWLQRIRSILSGNRPLLATSLCVAAVLWTSLVTLVIKLGQSQEHCKQAMGTSQDVRAGQDLRGHLG